MYGRHGTNARLSWVTPPGSRREARSYAARDFGFARAYVSTRLDSIVRVSGMIPSPGRRRPKGPGSNCIRGTENPVLERSAMQALVLRSPAPLAVQPSPL